MYWESGDLGRYKWPLSATDVAREQAGEDSATQQAGIRWGGRWHHLASDVAQEQANTGSATQQDAFLWSPEFRWGPLATDVVAEDAQGDGGNRK